MIVNIIVGVLKVFLSLAGAAISLVGIVSSPHFRERASANKESVAFILMTIGDRFLLGKIPIIVRRPLLIRNGSANRTVGDPVTKRSSEWITIRVQQPGTAKAARRYLMIVLMLGTLGVASAVVMVPSAIGLRFEYSLVLGVLAASAYFLWVTLSYHSVVSDLQGLAIEDNPIRVVISKDSVFLLGFWTSGEFSRDTDDLRFSLYPGPFNRGLLFTRRGISHPVCRYPWFVADLVMTPDDLESLMELLNSTLQAHASDSTDGHGQENGQQCGGETREPAVG